jgi:hypothetical protein
MADAELSGDALLERARTWYRDVEFEKASAVYTQELTKVHNKASDMIDPDISPSSFLRFFHGGNILVFLTVMFVLLFALPWHFFVNLMSSLVISFLYFIISGTGIDLVAERYFIWAGMKQLTSPDRATIELPDDMTLRTKFWDHCVSELRRCVESEEADSIRAQIKEVDNELGMCQRDSTRLREAIKNATTPALVAMLQGILDGVLEVIQEKEDLRDLLMNRQKALRRCVDQIEACVVQRRDEFDAVALADEINERHSILKDHTERRREIMDAATIEIVGACIQVAQLAIRIDIENRIDAAAQFERASFDVQMARLESASDVPEIPEQLFREIVQEMKEAVSV